MKKRKKSCLKKIANEILILSIIVLLGALMAVIVCAFHQKKLDNDSETGSESETSITEDESESIALSMPYVLDSGLIIDTYFQYTGINPDCQEEEGTDVASIQLINKTGRYIKEALIEMTLDYKQTVHFVIKDLPTDAQLYAFDINNTSCSGTAVITGFKENVVFSDEYALDEEVVSIIYDVMSAEISNISDQSIGACKIIYHDQMDGILFGGISYQQEIETLEAGESIYIEMPECYIGGPMIVGTTD